MRKAENQIGKGVYSPLVERIDNQFYFDELVKSYVMPRYGPVTETI